MISFDDAVLVLSKWRDEEASLDFVLADSRWLTVMGRCTVADLDRFMLVIQNPDTQIQLGLAEATFNYEDRRATIRFVQKQINLTDAVCALRIKFPIGPIALLIERAGNPDGQTD